MLENNVKFYNVLVDYNKQTKNNKLFIWMLRLKNCLKYNAKLRHVSMLQNLLSNGQSPFNAKGITWINLIMRSSKRIFEEDSIDKTQIFFNFDALMLSRTVNNI